MRVTVQMPCAVVPGVSELGLVWPRSSVVEMARLTNTGERGPGGKNVADLFTEMGFDIRPILGTVRVDESRERRTGYLFVIFDVEAPSELEVAKMALFGISLIERDGLDLDMTRRRR